MTQATEFERQRQLAVLQAQVAQLRSDHKERSSDRGGQWTAHLYVMLGVGLLVVTMIAVAVLSAAGQHDTGYITNITVPSALALIAYGLNTNIRSVYHLADGNLSAMKRDLNIALGRIDQLQEVRVAEAQRTIPLVAEGDTLKIPADAQGLIVEVKEPKDSA